MATGRLGSSYLTSGSISTYTSVYPVPATYYSVFNISICNQGTSTVTFRIALSTSNSTPTGNAEFIEYGASIAPNGVFERTGIVLEGGKYVLVSTTGTTVSVNVWGIETSTT